MLKSIEYENESRQRLDAYLSGLFSELSRSHISELIKAGKITVNSKNVKAGYALQKGDSISVLLPDEPEKIELIPENIPLNIVYEDRDVIVIDKPKGMVVHPAAGHFQGTLVNALMYHCKDTLSGINGELRPGIVHRIDKDTTGLIIACKNDIAHNSIAAQLKEHSTTRRYIALVHGVIKEDEGVVDKNIDRARNDRKKMAVTGESEGRNAVTHYRVLERYKNETLVECRLETGRTHQIRVHMNYIHHPLCGDEVYGIKNDRFTGHGQYLHAYVLGFKHPVTGEYMEFRSELPEYFKNTLKTLKSRMN